jgi:hypothetical protein
MNKEYLQHLHGLITYRIKHQIKITAAYLTQEWY